MERTACLLGPRGNRNQIFCRIRHSRLFVVWLDRLLNSLNINYWEISLVQVGTTSEMSFIHSKPSDWELSEIQLRKSTPSAWWDISIPWDRDAILGLAYTRTDNTKAGPKLVDNVTRWTVILAFIRSKRIFLVSTPLTVKIHLTRPAELAEWSFQIRIWPS